MFRTYLRSLTLAYPPSIRSLDADRSSLIDVPMPRATSGLGAHSTEVEIFVVEKRAILAPVDLYELTQVWT